MEAGDTRAAAEQKAQQAVNDERGIDGPGAKGHWPCASSRQALVHLRPRVGRSEQSEPWVAKVVRTSIRAANLQFNPPPLLLHLLFFTAAPTPIAPSPLCNLQSFLRSTSAHRICPLFSLLDIESSHNVRPLPKYPDSHSPRY